MQAAETEPSRVEPRSNTLVARAWIVAVTTITCAAHLLFALVAQRVPRDLNFAWGPLPGLYEDLGRTDWGLVARRVVEPGGWQNVLVATWLRVAGRTGEAFTVATVPWLAVLVLATAALAWRWAGPWGAVAAAAWVAHVPVIGLASREGWVHVPETTLIVTAAATLAWDRGLTRLRTPLVLAATGALAITLRPSGVGWVGALLLAGAVAALLDRTNPKPGGRKPATRRAILGTAAILATWTVALATPLPMLRGYLGGKAAVRERYALEVADLATQVRVQLGWVGLAILVGAVVLLALRRARGGQVSAPDWLRRLLLASWLALPLALALVSGAGLDNFPLFYVALGLIAAHAAQPHAAQTSAARPHATPTATAPTPATRPISPRLFLAATLLAWAGTTGARAWSDVTAEPGAASQIATLLDQTCPRRGPRKPCILVADQGLFFPGSEEPGRLELFLLGEDAVRFVSLHRPGMASAAVAVVTWACPTDATGHTPGAARQQGREAAMAGLVQAKKLAPAWSGPAEGCTLTWWTPGGALSSPPR